MKKLFCLLFFFMFFISLADKTDSLVALLKTNIPDTLRGEILFSLATNFEHIGKPELAEKYRGLLFVVIKKLNQPKGFAKYYRTLGNKYYYSRDYDLSIKNYEKSAEFYTKAHLSNGIIACRIDIAGVFVEKGDMKKGLEENRKIISLIEKSGDNKMLSDVYGNIGICFSNISKYDSAIYYTTKAARLNEDMGNLNSMANNYCGLASINYNMNQFRMSLYYLNKINKSNTNLPPALQNWIYGFTASVYTNLEQLDSALFYCIKAIEYSKKTNDRYSLINALLNQAEVYNKLKKNKLALDNIQQAISLSKAIESDALLAKAYTTYGSVATDLKLYNEAINYFNLSNELEIKNNNSSNVLQNIKGSAKVYGLMGNYKQHSFFLDSLIRYKDRLNETEMAQHSKEMEIKHETEKKDLQIETAHTHILLEEEKNKQKEKVIWFGSLALIVTLILGTLAYFNFRKFKKANKTINSQNVALSIQKKEVEEQKYLVEEKQKEIIDSINYAKRIQSAVLTNDDVWTKVSPEHFVLFKPKDIVSGDFYWAYNTPNNRSVFALADCTGHGVPGGFMSMLGNSFLNEIVIENKIFSAPIILNKLREKIINALDQKGNDQQKDGMDIALCVWNKLNNTLEYAGANNPLMLVRNNILSELKADKMPIGKYLTDTKPFNSQTIQLQPGDCLYMSTDGFPDQFGGPKGKKLKHKQLEKLLIEVHHIPMRKQLDALDKSFLDWKGDLEQIDDVAVIGIRV
ncbi:MAG: SpoIIE family protein phosphatase [Bacteroidetes bacterium]|nr:SpoIIE family protein phosphatase [Bacteroidota bacterium]